MEGRWMKVRGGVGPGDKLQQSNRLVRWWEFRTRFQLLVEKRLKSSTQGPSITAGPPEEGREGEREERMEGWGGKRREVMGEAGTR